MTTELEGKGDEELENETLKRFLEYKEIAQNNDKKTIIGEKDKIALARAKMNFEVMKKAKRGIQVKKRKSNMREFLKKDGGLENITVTAETYIDELDQASRKRDEFPDDEECNIHAEMAEAKVDAIADAGDEIDDDKELGLKERPRMRYIINRIREKRCYCNMWKDAKTLYLKGNKEEL